MKKHFGVQQKILTTCNSSGGYGIFQKITEGPGTKKKLGITDLTNHAATKKKIRHFLVLKKRHKYKIKDGNFVVKALENILKFLKNILAPTSTQQSKCLIIRKGVDRKFLKGRQLSPNKFYTLTIHNLVEVFECIIRN